MRDNRGVTCIFRHLDSSQSFGQRTDLVEFNQDRVSNTFLDTFFQDLGVGYKQIVTNQLDFVTQNFGLVFEASPVRFVQTVFDRDDWVLFGQVFQEVSELFRSESFVAFASQNIFAIFIEFRCSTVHRQSHVFAQLVTSLFYRFSDNSQCFGVRTQVWRVATFVAYRSAHTFSFQNLSQSMEHFRTDTNGFFQSFSPDWLNHKLLNINVVISMFAAIDDIHHRQWH
ncbi:Uncharacterised protein [Yersinia enterocolitica]|nr:Uncharacterised protein [Yersinia enterocolitica]